MTRTSELGGTLNCLILQPHIDKTSTRLLTDAAKTATSYNQVEFLLREHSSPSDKELLPFLFAFGYVLRPREEMTDDLGPYSPSITSRVESGDVVRFPPPLSEIYDDDVSAWASEIDRSDHPLLVARLGDLLWLRKFGAKPHLYAQAAADAFLQVAKLENINLMDRVHGLERAIDLARSISDDKRLGEAIGSLFNFAKNGLEHPESPGPPIQAVEQLAAVVSGAESARVVQLAEEGLQLFHDDPHLADPLFEVIAKIETPDRRREVRSRQVNCWRNAANANPKPFMKVDHLQEALRRAVRFELAEEAIDIRRELGGIAPEDLGLSKFPLDLSPGAEELDRFIGQFTKADSLPDALTMLAGLSAPHGNRDAMEQQVDLIRQEAPLQYLVPRALIGADNATPIFKGDTEEKQRRMMLAEQQALIERTAGVQIEEALKAIEQQFGRPTRDELRSYFETEMVEPFVAERFSRALELFWDGYLDESAHILVPRLEHVFRNLARAVGVPVVKESDGTRPGGVTTLGGLLAGLRPRFQDPATYEFYASVLVDPLGLNLRNKISHGLTPYLDGHEVALLLQIALELAHFQTGPANPVGPNEPLVDP